MEKTLMVALLLAFGLAIQIQAAGTVSNQGTKAGQTVDTQVIQGSQNGSATQTQEQNRVMNQGEDVQIQTQEQEKTKTKEVKKVEKVKGKVDAESHRSVVAEFVHSLTAVADRNGGIGQEVRTIAQQQNQIKDKSSDIIYAVQSRSKIKTFFIGTSYKNLGELRSQTVQTRNQIEQLKKLMENVLNEADKTELQNQIQALEQEQTDINNFIADNENKFSLFGWAVKIFRK